MSICAESHGNRLLAQGFVYTLSSFRAIREPRPEGRAHRPGGQTHVRDLPRALWPTAHSKSGSQEPWPICWPLSLPRESRRRSLLPARRSSVACGRCRLNGARHKTEARPWAPHVERGWIGAGYRAAEAPARPTRAWTICRRIAWSVRTGIDPQSASIVPRDNPSLIRPSPKNQRLSRNGHERQSRCNPRFH